MDANIHLDESIDFEKYWLVLKRRWVPVVAIFAGVVGLSLVHALSLEKIYQAEAELLIKVDSRSAKLTGLENGTGEIKGLTQESDPVATEAEIVQSRPIIHKVIEELDLRNDDGELFKYKDIAASLKVSPIEGTDLLEISYTNKEPELAASLVNKVIELYIEDHTLYNRSETASANKFIAQQLPKVEANVKQAEANLRSFKNQNRIANLEKETTANIDSLSNIATEIDKVEATLEDLNARYARLNSQLNMSWQEASAISSLSQSLAVQRALEQLQEVKVSLAQKRNYLSDLAPQIIALKEEEADLTALLNRQIAETLGSEQQPLIQNINILSLGELKQEQITEFANIGLRKEGLEKRLITLRKTYNSYQEQSDTLPRLQEQQRELERRVKAAQSTYQTLLNRLQETQIAEQQNIGNVRVVAEAIVPNQPIGSSKKLIVAAGGVMGTLLGVAVAFMLELRDRTLKNTQEIEAMLPYPLLGIVPDQNKITTKSQFLLPDSSTINLPNLVAINQSLLPIREAYHNIQVNLQLLDNQIPNKVIVVTSGVSGEGKSSVAANLAIVKAQCGEKVLLIDGDLRRPTQHHVWEVSNNVGLSDVLNQKVEWYDILQEVIPNIDVITSGSISNDPVSLLTSPSIQTLIEHASGYFDSIILDTPPLVGLADSKILSKSADGLLLVVRPSVAHYGSVTAVKKILEAADFKVLGVVANGVDGDRESYNYRTYYPDKKYLEAG